MKIFVITDFIIYPPNGGAQVRIFGLLSHLSKNHEVILFAPTRRAGDADGIRHLREMGIKVETVEKPRKRNLYKALSTRFKAFFSPVPAYWVLTNDDIVASGIANAIQKHKPDVIQIEYLSNCRFIDSLPKDIPVILDEYDVVSDREIAVVQILGKSLKGRLYVREAKKVPAFERNMFSRMDTVIACSDIDQARFKEMSPDIRVRTVPNGVDLTSYEVAPAVDDHSIVLTGSLDSLPNIEAAMDLAHDVLPRVRQIVPDVKAKIVGRHPGPDVRALADDGLEIIADVPDIRPFIAEATVVVVPLRTGGGTRTKILEAMAIGKAIVSTSKGAEGLEVTDGYDIILRDDYSEFAQTTAELLLSPEKRIELGANARKTVEAKYGYEELAAQLGREFTELLKEKERMVVQ